MAKESTLTEAVKKMYNQRLSLVTPLPLAPFLFLIRLHHFWVMVWRYREGTAFSLLSCFGNCTQGNMRTRYLEYSPSLYEEFSECCQHTCTDQQSIRLLLSLLLPFTHPFLKYPYVSLPIRQSYTLIVRFRPYRFYC